MYSAKTERADPAARRDSMLIYPKVKLTMPSEAQWLKKRISPTTRLALSEGFVRRCPPLMHRASEALFDLPIPAYVRREKFLFIHVPKNAGTSIAMQVYKRIVAHRPAWFFSASDHDWFATRATFAIVRNPWDRLIAAYEFARQGKGENAFVNPSVASIISKSKSFKHFLMDHLLRDPNNLVHKDPTFKTQASYLCDIDGENIIVNNVFRFEELRLMQDWLRGLGVEVSLDMRMNKTLARGEFPNYYRDNEMIEAVSRIYQSDVEHFGYSFE